MKPAVLLVLGLLAYSSGSVVPVRPNYLTEEDFARARQLPATPVNGTIFNPPHHPVEFPVARNAWTLNKWPNARVPYVIDANFDAGQRAEIARAMDNYHRATCVRFEPRQFGESDFVTIIRDDNTCGFAQFCKAGGPQIAQFGGGCISSGTMTFELGHTLCFWYEQTRSDRDSWIAWNTNICYPDAINDGISWSTLDLFYDYVSIQHNESQCYNGCIVPRTNGVTKCGSGGSLSVLDAEKINAFYDCGGCYSYRFRPISKLSLNENMVFAATGTRGETLYPCRAYHNGDIIPGKGDPVERSCWVGYNGQEHEKKDNFEILTNPKNVGVQWLRKPAGGAFPSNAIPGGRSAEREPFYIGRCTILTLIPDFHITTIPGKIQRSASDTLFVVYGGIEYSCTEYDVLVCQ